ncbi:hypothetical protein [Bacillus sp. 3255]|uniref:hypothetical protein n=1 Tax=Bacillus sp. 3255 TaxID=2817904 RepID=UPI00286D1B10|nr:hypothetical protein [Bacillus sp. 3255]
MFQQGFQLHYQLIMGARQLGTGRSVHLNGIARRSYFYLLGKKTTRLWAEHLLTRYSWVVASRA